MIRTLVISATLCLLTIKVSCALLPDDWLSGRESATFSGSQWLEFPSLRKGGPKRKRTNAASSLTELLREKTVRLISEGYEVAVDADGLELNQTMLYFDLAKGDLYNTTVGKISDHVKSQTPAERKETVENTTMTAIQFVQAAEQELSNVTSDSPFHILTLAKREDPRIRLKEYMDELYPEMFRRVRNRRYVFDHFFPAPQPVPEPEPGRRAGRTSQTLIFLSSAGLGAQVALFYWHSQTFFTDLMDGHFDRGNLKPIFKDCAGLLVSLLVALRLPAFQEDLLIDWVATSIVYYAINAVMYTVVLVMILVSVLADLAFHHFTPATTLEDLGIAPENLVRDELAAQDPGNPRPYSIWSEWVRVPSRPGTGTNSATQSGPGGINASASEPLEALGLLMPGNRNAATPRPVHS